MTVGDRKLRVAVVYGAWPADSSHLRELSKHVELSIHHSNWLHFEAPEPEDLPGVVRCDYPPVVRTDRGHLGFVYNGLHKGLSAVRPDVVHAITEPWGLLAVQTAHWRRLHRRSRLVFHGCDTIWHHGRPAKRLGRRALLKLSMGALDAFAAENTKALDMARHSGLRPGALLARIHTNPRDTEIWRPPSASERAEARGRLGLDEDTPAIGMSARLVPEKGVLHLLEAARLMHSTGFRGRFFVAGTGPLAEAVRAADPILESLGSLPHPAGVRDLMWALDVFACPSLPTPTWEDQGPRALLEAMMCGVVPVATPSGGIPEMLEGHGVLAADLDVPALADAVEKAVVASGDPLLRREVSDYATSVYSGRAVAERLVQLWNSLVPTVGTSMREEAEHGDR